MTGVIFLKQGDALTRLRNAQYRSEDLLQKLIADNPEILAGELINPDRPRRWLLIAREMGVPEREDGGYRWSLDHLFLDQDGVPTLVETKRATDTRVRREVVAQMLDYAANGSTRWSVETLRTEFEIRCSAEGLEASEILATFLGPEREDIAFWDQVKSNLLAGRLRLLFVADVIPDSLARIIEFLNDQMNPAEVLGIELPQYLDTTAGIQTIVPRVIGRTPLSEARKSVRSSAPSSWTEETFCDLLRDRYGDSIKTLCARIAASAREQGLDVAITAGTLPALVLRWPGERATLLQLAAHASGPRLYLMMPGWLQLGISAPALAELRLGIASLPGVAGPLIGNATYPWVPLRYELDSETTASRLIALLSDALRAVQPVSSPGDLARLEGREARRPIDADIDAPAS